MVLKWYQTSRLLLFGKLFIRFITMLSCHSTSIWWLARGFGCIDFNNNIKSWVTLRLISVQSHIRHTDKWQVWMWIYEQRNENTQTSTQPQPMEYFGPCVSGVYFVLFLLSISINDNYSIKINAKSTAVFANNSSYRSYQTQLYRTSNLYMQPVLKRKKKYHTNYRLWKQLIMTHVFLVRLWLIVDIVYINCYNKNNSAVKWKMMWLWVSVSIIAPRHG